MAENHYDSIRERTRNFCIVAHIDHGKSTLADRMIERTGLLTSREMQDQVLDNMDLERERGITIKSQAVRLIYKARDGVEYIFNLIDTPGHVDFNYEVSRSLAACDGAILVVDATQGIQAQTLANVYLALEHDLDVFPVINKIDLPSAMPEEVKHEIEDVIGIEAEDAPLISAKQGIGIDEVLEAVVAKIPPPEGDAEAPLKALVFDSLYDSYRGVIVFCRIRDGVIRKGMPVRMMATGAVAEVVEVGYFGPGQFIPCEELAAGQVGYFTASIKNIKDARVGDTVTEHQRPCAEPLPGYKKAQPMVYCGLYPADSAKYPDLRDALEKLQLNDAALFFEPETSLALGFGFRCGFLGLLHMEVILQRLEREYDLDLISTAPGVVYKVYKTRPDLDGAGRCIQSLQDGRHDDRADQSFEPARTFEHRAHGGAHRQRGDHGDDRVHRLHHAAVPGAARPLHGHRIHRGDEGSPQIRASAQRDHLRLLRCPQVQVQGIRVI